MYSVCVKMLPGPISLPSSSTAVIPEMKSRLPLRTAGEKVAASYHGQPGLIACKPIIQAVDDAGVSMDQIDGVASYAMDRNDPVALQTALGFPQLRFSNMQWGGGGGGGSGAVQNAATAIHAGLANYVVVFRALAQGQFG